MRSFQVLGKNYSTDYTAQDIMDIASIDKFCGSKLICIGSKQFLNDKELRKTKARFPINYGRKIGDKFIWTFII